MEEHDVFEGLKSGPKTTEFYLSLLAILGGLFLSLGILPDTHVAVKIVGAIVAALGAVGYSFARASVKKAESAVKIEAAKTEAVKAEAAKTEAKESPPEG